MKKIHSMLIGWIENITHGPSLLKIRSLSSHVHCYVGHIFIFIFPAAVTQSVERLPNLQKIDRSPGITDLSHLNR